ncbi:hypothetical protein Nepgr_005813 [Nepenthes gracilis]|uniref:RING-type domain-containing protein n=1 Tax=Nepenthes gracilis TaxID=150966 RepID=A0AAD3XGR1_NEPGR|nr:hypothetical protein Nepgr_005813 [Nepenthes gracilis]
MPINNRPGHHVELRLSPGRPPAAAPVTSPQPPSSLQTAAQIQTLPKPNPKLLPLLLQALVMTLIISIFVIFVGVAAIIFFHFCIAGGAFHRRHHHQPYSDRSRSGYSPEELKSLPRTKFNPETESKSTELCAICLDSMSIGDWCRELPACKHLFHLNCVDKWLLKVPACPICRTSVRLNSSGKCETIDGCTQLWPVFR